MKVIVAVVLYPSKLFDNFLDDCLTSIFAQSYKDFTLALFCDGISESAIQKKLEQMNYTQPIIFYSQPLGQTTPSAIRDFIIKSSIQQNFDYLCFVDFDEKIDSNRIEMTLKNMHSYDFSYCNARITDSALNNKIANIHQAKNIPATTNNHLEILDKNFIGLGAITLNLRQTKLYDFRLPSNIIVFDWFLATHMLLQGASGVAISNTFTNYRQHPESFVGANHYLDQHSLDLGIRVKKNHYQHFREFHPAYQNKYHQIIELEKFLRYNSEKYIHIINSHFDPQPMWWWENIKTLEEIKEWI
ncbi:hypothetical protein BBW65_03995 [Helicobacter enhydrae]|uniref:Glycosyltransferase 2-like domain-containing protein n=1 Tax=Helicobacter enhydrae TaxID=222136 RepID=A0A1B1U5N6_9HELI|nr:hypothetical protein [Helicobacter enhydrae]ANV98012.1 hypothetical protein BBW65_03995 [Helicobacter enhydrae]